MDLQFSQDNTFRLLARTTLMVTQGVRNPKLKVIQLTQGSVDLKLDDYPPDLKFQVETPSAICGAVGTRFSVSFEDESIAYAGGVIISAFPKSKAVITIIIPISPDKGVSFSGSVGAAD